MKKTGKNIKRKIALLLAGVMMFSVTGCQGIVGPKVAEEAEGNKTQLYVGNYLGGVGDEWLKDAIERFEEKYADVSFEDGKKGVQVIISQNDRATVGGPRLIENIESYETEVYFSEGNFYYEWVNRNKFYDITEYVTKPLSEFGEERSIADKLSDQLRESLTMDGKIYAIPHWMGSYGITYNATLFDANNWYYAADGTFTNASGNLSSGPDGKQGTYDDGMPATYDQFFALMDEINRDNATPLQWAGASPDYFVWMLGSMFADYEGYDSFMLNYNFDGTATLVKPNTVNVETGTYETEQVQITENNGYELARQEGILKTLEFAQKIIRGSGNYYDANTALSGSFKQQDAQLAFVRNATTTDKKPVAMIIEGSWWENESGVAFEAAYGAGATKYDSEFEYKYMPFPKADESKVGSENLWISPLESYCFLNPAIKEEKVELAAKFLQFCHSDESLKAFTEITGILKPYEYEIDESELTSYSKSVIEATENSTVLLPKSNNKLYAYDSISFWLANFYVGYFSSGTSSYNVIMPLIEKNGNEYASDYKDLFQSIVKYRKDGLWPTFDSVLK